MKTNCKFPLTGAFCNFLATYCKQQRFQKTQYKSENSTLTAENAKLMAEISSLRNQFTGKSLQNGHEEDAKDLEESRYEGFQVKQEVGDPLDLGD